MFAKKAFLILLLLISLVSVVQAQDKGTIVYVILRDGVKIDPATGDYPDMPYIFALEDAGYQVIQFYEDSLSFAGEAVLDTLYEIADLIIMGRSTPSTIYGDHKNAWNEITTPILNLELWNCRNSRLNWFNTTTMLSIAEEGTIYNAIINEPNDPVFAGWDTSVPIPWIEAPFDAVGVPEAGNGIVLASLETDNSVLFVRFEPGVEFYDGAGDEAGGHRTVIGNGRDNGGLAPFHYYAFTPESEQIFLAEVARMVALSTGIAVDDQPTSPADFVLSQNYPNPFNPSTTIPFNLPENSHVRLTLANIQGQEIIVLADGEYHAGPHEVVFDAGNLAAGVYLYKLETEKYMAVKKLALVK